MLQIYIYGPTEEGFIDLDPDAVLQMESLAEAFDEELGTGDFSLPIDIPWTDNNRKKFGFAERIQNFSVKNNYFKCVVYNNYFPELPNAKITMLDKSGTFAFTKGKFSASVSGSKGLFGSLIKNKKLKDLQLGGAITWQGQESRKFAEDLMKGLYPQYPQIAFAPVAIENFIDKDRADYTSEFLALDTVNTIIDDSINWTFERPSSTNPAQIAIGQERMDYQTVPFFKIKFVLKKIFEEHGYIVSGDFLDGTDFDDLVMFNNYGIENYAINYTANLFADLNTSINPSNHVPDILIKEFLNGLFSLFNIFPTFPGVDEVKLVYRKNHIKKRSILSLNKICSNKFTSTLNDAGNEKGYKLNYVWDSADQYYSDRVKDLKDKTLVATVATRGLLDTLNTGRQLTTNDIANVQADNLYYVVADATSNPIKWDVYAEKLNEYISGSGTRQVDCNISTLCTWVEFDNTAALSYKKNYVGTRQPGSYQNKKNVRVTNPFSLKVFYIKPQVNPATGNVIPMSFNNNRNYLNNIIVPYSLSWHGTDGLAINFHKDWEELRDRMEIIKTSITADQKVLTEMANHNCYEINNILFIPYRTERSIPMKAGMEISLVPL